MKYKINRASVVFLAIIGLMVSVAHCGIKLPAVIGDNMVIQQNTEVPLWGRAEPNENIIVSPSWRGSTLSTKADTTGKWTVKIKTPTAGGPHRITIKGNNTVTVRNILSGEVWLCSGQSNMKWSLRKSDNAQIEIASANYPDIRLFTVGRAISKMPLSDCNGFWKPCKPNTASDFSAIGYFFGRELYKKLNVPIGLIESDWGSTTAEAWISEKILRADPDYAHIFRRWEDWEKLTADAKKRDLPEPKKPETQQETCIYNMVRPHRQPAVLYNGMIAPIIPYGIKGVIWYQGESNRDRAYQYRKLFPALINNWRHDWNQGDFPFYYVQIAPNKYSKKVAAAELREAQMMTLSAPNTGMVVTMDLVADPNFIHPTNKLNVGKRLSLVALAKTYGFKGIVYSGPLYKSMKIEGKKIRLYFDYVGSGLMAKDGPLTYFTIAGPDKNFVDADAVIDGNTILVSIPKVPNPIAVRFAWSDIAVPNLFNREGLPASSFRTDDWPGVTFGQN